LEVPFEAFKTAKDVDEALNIGDSESGTVSQEWRQLRPYERSGTESETRSVLFAG